VQNFFVDKGRYALEQIILFIVVGIFMLRMSPLDTIRVGINCRSILNVLRHM